MRAFAVRSVNIETEPKLEASVAKTLRALAEELKVFALDRGSAIDTVLPVIGSLLETDNLLLFTPAERIAGGFELARYHDTGRIGFVRERLAAFFESAPQRYAWYDPTRPEPEQRNRVLDALDIIPPDEYEQSAIYHKAMRPAGMHRRRQPRVLLCDGPSLLAWFGTFYDGAVPPRLISLLRRVTPMLQRRLRVERMLERAPLGLAGLAACLSQLGAPAFVIAESGAIVETNDAGRALLDTSPLTRRALAEALRRRPTPMPVQLTRLTEPGAPALWLAIMPSQTADESVVAAVTRASERWELTRRQREVLEHVINGAANVTIAAELQVSVRAIELHVTSLLDRAGVDSRSALVAQVLLA